MSHGDRRKRLALIASKGTLDEAYPPFILASTAAAMDMEVAVFFTFYGLQLLNKKLDARVAPASNPAMPVKIPFGPPGLRRVSWPVPNLLAANLPGFESLATAMMKKTFADKGVATLETLRRATLEAGATLIACQMTMEVFGLDRDDFIDGVTLGGAASFLDFAADADISLFV